MVLKKNSILFFAAVLSASVINAAGRKDCLDMMEAAVDAYPRERRAEYAARVEREGITEHGFARLTANMGILVANGRKSELKDEFVRMMDLCAREQPIAQRRNGTSRTGHLAVGAEFAVKELVFAVDEAEKSGLFPKENTDSWRAAFSAMQAVEIYSVKPEPGDPVAHNWAIFGAASEQARIAAGMGGDAEWVEKYVADQLRFFDGNGMYRDPGCPIVYDFVTRLQYAVILSCSYDGPSRRRIEQILELSAEPTLAMQSVTGEIPFGGRSNQFLHNETCYAALCEWYAAHDAKRGNMERAKRFRAASERALASVRRNLAENSGHHVKNSFPPDSMYGCEQYAYFDKYMVTMGSWAYLAFRFADESIPLAAECAEDSVFVTSPDFHRVMMNAGDWTLQFDLNAQDGYDATGLGRILKRGAPGPIALSVPFPVNSHYHLDVTNAFPLSIGPQGVSRLAVEKAANGEIALSYPGGRWTTKVGADKIEMSVEQKGDISFALPAFEFDGEAHTEIECTSDTLAVSYRGWRCCWKSDAPIVDTGKVFGNRNGHYRLFEAWAKDRLRIVVTICKLQNAGAEETRARGLLEGFRNPPQSARSQVWWHWMAGNVTKNGITADLEAMAEVGIGGAILFDAGLGARWGVPEGPIAFNTPEWYAMVRFAAEEAKRLGLELGIANCSGWANSGGPWNTPAHAMKTVCWTSTPIRGGGTVVVKLPQPKDEVGFYADIAVVAFPTPKDSFKIKDWKFKCLSDPGRRYIVRDERIAPELAVVSRAAVTNLTACFADDGMLTWNAPVGDWTVLRIGYRAMNRKNGTGTRMGKGLECDKLSKEALRIHWNGYVRKTVKALGPTLAGPKGSLKTVLNDSYEAGTQNWTDGFDREFRSHVGYDIVPWLPTIAGFVVDSVADTEMFYHDFRTVVSGMFVENYAREMRRLAHEDGLELAIEPYGEIPSDDLLYGENADIPTAEFWAKMNSPHWVRQAASIAHARGRRIVAAESFTTNAKDGRWQNTPWSMKPKCDWVYSEGLNRIIYHRFAHQPWTAPSRLPGMTMGPFGVHFDRTQTWWMQAKPWLQYQQRCQYLLQEGEFVCDVAWYCPAEYLYINWGANPHKMPIPVPDGFMYDFISDNSLAEMKVDGGRLVLPSGQRYGMLVLPEKSFKLPAEGVNHLARLRAAGAQIVPFEEACAALSVCTPDVNWSDAKAKLNWIHRRSGRMDWYFVASPDEMPRRIDVSFRTVGRKPELWNPETGETRPVRQYAVNDVATTVRITFGPCGSWFVVFCEEETGTQPSALPAEPFDAARTGPLVDLPGEQTSVSPVAGDWSLTFPVDWYVGGRTTREIVTPLVDWTTLSDPDLKYFSGTAIYRRKMSCRRPMAGSRSIIDLGDVKNFADVTVNGNTFRTLWKPPFRVDVTDVLRDGYNEVEVRVTNLWPNRIIGDDFKPEDCAFELDKPIMQRRLNAWPKFILDGEESPSGKYTFTTWKHWTKDDRPLPSGLLGPVFLRTVKGMPQEICTIPDRGVEQP